MTPIDSLCTRRNFLSGIAAAGAAAVLSSPAGLSAQEAKNQAAKNPEAENKARPFRMDFAPHPGSFRASAGEDLLDQIRFAHDNGFTAWEHNPLADESPEMQEKVGKLLSALGMKRGVFVAYADFERPTFAVRKPEFRDAVLTKIKAAVDVAKRCGAKYCTVVPGTVDQQYKDAEPWNRYGGPRLAEGYQTANVIDLLRECAEIFEPHGIVMVLEPLNWYANHGGLFLQRSDQAFAICRAVNSPSCKILFDIYHQQITEGNLIPNIDQSWSEIAYFQSGDNPGRKEPGTGEIHYANVFQHIHDRAKQEGRDFIVGMEHGNSIKGTEGEQALIAAYRAVEPK